MKRYIILTPPGGPLRDHRTTRFIADRFAVLAFLFPGPWLLMHRCWWSGLAALAAQGLAGWLADQPGLFWAGTLSSLALSLLIGLEARHMQARNLVRRGWQEEAVLLAPDLVTAEAMFFETLPAPEPFAVPAADWTKISPRKEGPAYGGPALGLFDMGKGR
ncbi:DUF2628 domain-containing protein [Rhizobium sp. SGZ-381]|uniref:DUF2628 domain-containing protein n=1 Tax=Rhizobium sp. SGZ-381 TaxID=3342800 RepID=UPI00367106A2